MSIESIEMIPMAEGSIFGEPYTEAEFYNITTDFTKWDPEVDSIRKTYDMDDATEIYDETLKQFAEKFDYYLLGPTGKFGTNVLETISVDIHPKNLNDFQTVNKALYKIFYRTVDNEVLIRIRYAEVGNQE